MINELEHHVAALRRAAQEVAGTHDGLVDAIEEERDAKRRLFSAVCEAVQPAVQAIAEDRKKVRVADGMIEASVVELDARGGARWYLAADAGQWWLCVTHPEDPRFLVPLRRNEPLPKKLRIDRAIAHLGERLRASLNGRAHEQRLAARRLADRLSAITILLADD